MGYFLILIGIFVLIYAFLSMLEVKSSIHQIYVQLQFATCAILIGAGAIINSIDSLKEKYEQVLRKEQTKTNQEK